MVSSSSSNGLAAEGGAALAFSLAMLTNIQSMDVRWAESTRREERGEGSKRDAVERKVAWMLVA